MPLFKEGSETTYYSSCQHVQLEELVRPPPQELLGLVHFVRDNELAQYPTWSKMVNNWVPTYGKNPERYIPMLYSLFLREVEAFQERGIVKPRFMDAGSGHGIMGRIAQLAGFEAYSVEHNEKLHQQALLYHDQINALGIGNPDDIHLVHGSYYLKYFYQRAVDQYRQNYRIGRNPTYMHLAGLALELGMSEPDEHEADRILKSFVTGTEALEAADLVDGSRLHIDLVYTYPSDLFFRYAFFAQMGIMLPEGSRILATSLNSQIQRALQDDQPMNYNLFPHTSYDNGDFPMFIEFEKR